MMWQTEVFSANRKEEHVVHLGGWKQTSWRREVNDSGLEGDKEEERPSKRRWVRGCPWKGKGGKSMPGPGNSKHFDFAGELVMFAKQWQQSREPRKISDLEFVSGHLRVTPESPWLTMRRRFTSFSATYLMCVFEQVLEIHSRLFPLGPLSTQHWIWPQGWWVARMPGSHRPRSAGPVESAQMSMRTACWDDRATLAETFVCRLLVTMSAAGETLLPERDPQTSCCVSPGNKKANYLGTERAQGDDVASAHSRASARPVTSQPLETQVKNINSASMESHPGLICLVDLNGSNQLSPAEKFPFQCHLPVK